MSSRGGLMEKREYTMEELLSLIEELPEDFIISIELEVRDGNNE